MGAAISKADAVRWQVESSVERTAAFADTVKKDRDRLKVDVTREVKAREIATNYAVTDIEGNTRTVVNALDRALRRQASGARKEDGRITRMLLGEIESVARSQAAGNRDAKSAYVDAAMH